MGNLYWKDVRTGELTPALCTIHGKQLSAVGYLPNVWRGCEDCRPKSKEAPVTPPT